MEFFRIHRDIPFMRYATIFNVVSALTFVAAVFFLATKGLNLSIEFKGGTVVEVKYPHAADLDRMRVSLREAGFEHPEASTFGTASDVMIRLPITPGTSTDSTSARAFEGLCRAEKGTARTTDQVTAQGEHHAHTACLDAAGKELISLQRVEFVGPQVGEELAQNGLNALIMVVIGVMAYLAIRFEWKYAVAAIIANLHDVVIIMGFFAFFQWEF
ncbi:MAG TPA: protein translocase subunit SecF, partial [Pseudoduganella sp.]